MAAPSRSKNALISASPLTQHVRRPCGGGLKDRIKHRANKWHAQLPHWQERRKQLIEPQRRAVERVFGTLKRSYGYRRVRYRRVACNKLKLCSKVLAYNLRQAAPLNAAAG